MASNALSSSLNSVTYHYAAYKTSLFAEVEKQKSTHKINLRSEDQYEYSEEERHHRVFRVVDHYEQLFNHLQKNPQAEGITGLLLLYPRCILHVLESSSDVLNTILQDLRAMEEKGHSHSLLKDARILVMSYSVPAHVFHEWGFRCLNLPLSLQEEARSPQTMESLVPDCLSLLYRLCAHLLKGSTDQGDREEGEAGEEVQEQDLLVEEETVAQLCHSTALRTPASFLQAYHAPLHVLMDSEIVWPTQCHLYW